MVSEPFRSLENQNSTSLGNNTENFREKMMELQSSMDAKFEQFMKKIELLINARVPNFITTSKSETLPPNLEQIKATCDGNLETIVDCKVFEKKSTRGISNRKVLISGYNQDEDCLYVETFEYVQKKLLISGFSQIEDCLCVETYEGVTNQDFMIPKENGIQSTSPSREQAKGGSSQHVNLPGDDRMDESDWEDGSVPTQSSTKDQQEEKVSSITIEFEASLDSTKRKAICRPSAEDKELAEFVHKVHLLCLLGRGRLIYQACNDPLIQAAPLSLIPAQFLEISEVSKLTATVLGRYALSAVVIDEMESSALIFDPGGGYVESGLYDEMLQILVRMHRAEMIYSSYALGSVLKSYCLNFSGSEECGRLLHGCAVKLGWDLDVVVGTALLDMYAKIGDLSDATLLFKLLPKKNVVMYNAMIVGLSRTENTNDESSSSRRITVFSWIDDISRLVLIPGLQYESVITRVAESIADASISEHMRVSFKEAGAVKHLVQLMDHHNDFVRLTAIHAMERLSVSNDVCQRIEAKGILYLFISSSLIMITDVKHLKKYLEELRIPGSKLKENGLYWGEREKIESTEFYLCNFLKPFLLNYDGCTMLVGCDFLCLGDVNEWGLQQFCLEGEKYMEVVHNSLGPLTQNFIILFLWSNVEIIFLGGTAMETKVRRLYIIVNELSYMNFIESLRFKETYLKVVVVKRTFSKAYGTFKCQEVGWNPKEQIFEGYSMLLTMTGTKVRKQ